MAVKKKCTTAGQTDSGQKTGTEAVQRFGKEQLLASARYKQRKDLVSVLLEDGRKYTIADVDRLVDQFMKGKVE